MMIVSCDLPWQSTIRFVPLLNICDADQCWLLQVEFRALSSFCLLSVRLQSSSSLHPLFVEKESNLLNEEMVNLQENENCNLAIAVRGSPSMEKNSLVIKWKGQSGEEMISMVEVIDEGNVGAVSPRSALTIKAEQLGEAVARQPLSIRFVLRSRHSRALTLKLVLEVVDLLMFSGCKQMVIRLLPGSEHVLSLTLLPLSAGPMIFPRLRISSIDLDQTDLDRMMNEAQPPPVFVMPTPKKRSSSSTGSDGVAC